MSTRQIPLGEIANLQAGIGFPPKLQGRPSGDYPFAKVGDISRGGRSESTILSTADNYVDDVDVKNLRGKLIPVGSVLFAKIGEAIRQNHRVVVGRSMLIDNNAMAAIPGNNLNSRFLYHFLKTVDFYVLAPATTVPALRKSELEKILVPDFPLDEQRRIAAILDQADALRAKRREALAELDGLAQAIFVEIFGNTKHWPVKPLDDLADDMLIGLVRSASEFGQDFETPYVRMNAIGRNGEFIANLVQRTDATADEIKRYKLNSGDILFNTRNSEELVGKTAIFREEGIYVFNNNVMRIRFNSEVEPEFVASVFLTQQVRQELQQRKSGTTSVFAIYGRDIKTLPIPVPPIKLQRIFSARKRAIEDLKKVHQRALTELDALFASLQHRAFRGEL